MKPSPRSARSRHADFEDLYKKYSREVWALAYARWMNADTALDIAQEAFLRLWKQMEGGKQSSIPEPGCCGWPVIWRKTMPKAPFAVMGRIPRRR